MEEKTDNGRKMTSGILFVLLTTACVSTLFAAYHTRHLLLSAVGLFAGYWAIRFFKVYSDLNRS